MKIWELEEGEEYIVNGLYSIMACEKYRIKKWSFSIIGQFGNAVK